MKIGTIIFEDNELLRESIAHMIALHPKMELLGSFPDANTLDRVFPLAPELVLMDIEMPGISGIEATKIIRRHLSNAKILVLTVFEEEDKVLEAIKAGASGYLLKKHIAEKLFSAVEEIFQGGAPMSPGVAKKVIDFLQNITPSKNYQLTNQEQKILLSLSNGNSYKLIAAEYGITLDTVRTHIKNIYCKLEVHSQTEAVSKAIKEKLV